MVYVESGMNKKNIAILVFIIVLLAGAFALYLQRNAILSLKQNIEITSSATPVIQDQKITDNTKPFKINITYPQVAGQDEFNKIVKDMVDKEVADFKANSLANDEAVKKVDPAGYASFPREYDIEIGYDKGIVDQNAISVVINIYNFEGGAHGAEYSKAVNFNPQTKKEIALADLFPNNPNYLKTISDFSIKDLKKQIDPQMADDSWLTTGAGPTAENYSVFLINPSTGSGQATLTFYFQQYQVAAGAAGSFKVVFPK